MQKTDLLRLAASILWSADTKSTPGVATDIFEAIDKVAKMSGSQTMARDLKRTLRSRLSPHPDMQTWMKAKGPTPSFPQVMVHSKEWLLRMAGPAPEPTPQAYVRPTRRRRR